MTEGNDKKDAGRMELVAAGYTLAAIDNNLEFLQATPDDGELLTLALGPIDRELFNLALQHLRDAVAAGEIPSYQLIGPTTLVSSKIRS